MFREGKSHGPRMHQGIQQNITDHFLTILGLESPSFRQRATVSPEGLRLNIGMRKKITFLIDEKNGLAHLI